MWLFGRFTQLRKLQQNNGILKQSQDLVYRELEAQNKITK